jgi:hypothetical protein
MEIVEFYNHTKKIGIPNKIIAGYIATFIKDSKNGYSLSFEEILKTIRETFPDGYNEQKVHRFKELHESFSDEDINVQIARFRESAVQWGFPNSLIEDIISEFLITAKALDASSLDDILRYDILGQEDEE